MPVIPRFSPPSHLDDLSERGQRQWSDFLGRRCFERAKAGNPGLNDGPRRQFFNPVQDELDGELLTETVTWTAFPRQVTISSANDVERWSRADRDRHVQDEHCEWSVARDEHGNVTRVDFTCEGPEYWQVLALLQPDTVLELYRRHVSEHVVHEDLFAGPVYEPLNVWNAGTGRGCMHLVQRSNTLAAQIELAAAASVVRRRQGKLMSSVQELIRCGRYGAPQRHSDPHVGSQINALARAGRMISIADPVGLFIASVDLDDFELPTTNVSAAQCWQITRGTADRPVRVTFAPPPGETFTVSDVSIDGRAIQWGGQIADKIMIGLTGWASERTDHLVITDGCVGGPVSATEPDLERTVQDLARHR